MKITIIGTGYVGLVTATCLAEMGNKVTCIDIDQEKIDSLNNLKVPFFEPNLEMLVEKNSIQRRLIFTSKSSQTIKESSIIFICVGTPQSDDGSADMKFIYDVADDIANNLTEGVIVVLKSTVPVGTCDKVFNIINKKNKDKRFYVVNNPEFLKEGDAVRDFMNPDRIVVGAKDEYAIGIMKKIYAPFNMKKNRLVVMGNKEAELTKYAANSMLATKISFINEISLICDQLDIDIEDVRKGIGSDTRIGHSFIYPGSGYGGSCFPKDVKALISTAKSLGIDPILLKSTDERNNMQKLNLFNKIKTFYSNNLESKKFGIWGLSFKPETSDVREASSLVIIDKLIKEGCYLRLFDPVANQEILNYFGKHKNIEYYNDPYETIDGADAMILLTEWKMFRNISFAKLKDRLNKLVIFDGRNQYSPNELAKEGVKYIAIGRTNIKSNKLVVDKTI